MAIDYSTFRFAKPSDKAGPAPKKRIPRKPKPTRTIANKSGQGERLVLSKADWEKLRRHYWKTHPTVACGICGLPILRWEDFEFDHKDPRGMGGGRRDDSPGNLRPSHALCNRAKGSRREVKSTQTQGETDQ